MLEIMGKPLDVAREGGKSSGISWGGTHFAGEGAGAAGGTPWPGDLGDKGSTEGGMS